MSSRKFINIFEIAYCL